MHFSEKYNDIYCNPDFPEAEKNYVFIDANRIAERIQSAETFTVAELGFGYGLNYQLSVAAARSVDCLSKLIYYSCDEDSRAPSGDARLFEGDVADFLGQASFLADAWYFDGFSPAKNSAMWSAEVFSRAYELTAPGGTFSTYTAAGWVRRNLLAAGFRVEKKQGFGKKREMLIGSKT